MNKKTEKELNKILSELEDLDFEKKFKLLSKCFLNKEYDNHALPKANQNEILKVNLERFDCVTLVETITSMLLSKNKKEFLINLKKIRYEKNIVSWKTRNHYFSKWISNNKKNNLLKNIALAKTKAFNKKLNILKNYKTIKSTIKIITYKDLLAQNIKIKDGDIIAFYSNKKNLDYFHTGFILKKKKLALLHSSKIKKIVVIEDLSNFLSRNHCNKMTIVRINSILK